MILIVPSLNVDSFVYLLTIRTTECLSFLRASTNYLKFKIARTVDKKITEKIIKLITYKIIKS